MGLRVRRSRACKSIAARSGSVPGLHNHMKSSEFSDDRIRLIHLAARRLTGVRARSAGHPLGSDLEATDTRRSSRATMTLPRAADGLPAPGASLRLRAVRAGETDRAELEHYVRDASRPSMVQPCTRSCRPCSRSVTARVTARRGRRPRRARRVACISSITSTARRAGTDGWLPALGRSRRCARRPSRRDRGSRQPGGRQLPCRGAHGRAIAGVPDRARYRWIVFTATGALRQILAGLGAPLIELARADASQCAQARARVGPLLRNGSRVFAGYLRHAERLAGFAHRAPGH